MPEPTELSDPDFDAQMRGLFQEAEQRIQGRSAASTPKPEPAPAPLPPPPPEKDPAREAEERALKNYISLPQMLRPMVMGLEAISRATGDNTVALQKIEKANAESLEAQKPLPDLVAGLASLLEQKNSLNQRMFDALHEELKGYKDGFLLESVLKPIIRDLISLFDELHVIRRQMQEGVAEVGNALPDSPLVARLKNMEINIDHHCEFVVEILARLDVTMLPPGTGKLDKKTQRAVQVEMADNQEDEFDIVRSLKPGFVWKDRVLRAEEVVIKKWKEGILVALNSAGSTEGPGSQK